MIVDANILIYAVNESAPAHGRARAWLEEQLNGEARIALPWPTLLAFMRLTTSLRMSRTPISAQQSWTIVRSWLESPVVWIPSTSPQHLDIFDRLVATHEISGNLIPDAHLAAFAIEHGVPLASADSDFARFPEVRWVNPIAG